MGKSVAIVSVGGNTHRLVDWNRKVWYFEDHPYFGPMVCRKDGTAVKNQPGERSAFWVCYELWAKEQAGRREDRT